MKTENPNTPIFGTPEEARVAPKFEMPKTSMPGEVAYQLVHDEAMWMEMPVESGHFRYHLDGRLCPPGDDRKYGQKHDR